MVRAPVRPPRSRHAWRWVVLLALVLRLLRLPARWCANAWLYSAYPWPTVQALRSGQLPPFTGLHPPLWPTLHALSELWAPVPLLWLLASVLLSTLATGWIARHNLLAGLLLATSPVQLAYAAEVNNYPLAACLVAAALVLRDRAVAGRWLPLALVAALACWTHALAGLLALFIVLTLPRRRSLRVLVVVALLALPLVAPVLRLGLHLSAHAGTQPPFKVALVVPEVVRRFGLLWLLTVPAVIAGARRRPWLLLPAVGTAVALAVLTALRIAAPHQFPYWVLLGLPIALLAGSAAGREVRALAWVAVLLHGGLAVAQALPRLQTLARDLQQPRAVDAAVASLAKPWTCTGVVTKDCSGDALYLLLPRRVDDDDKRPLSPALWRLPPTTAMPAVQPYPMDWGDYHNGQPRRVVLNGAVHVVYVEDHVRDAILSARAAHPSLVVVLDAGPDSAEARALRALLGPEAQVVGGQVLWR